MLEGIETRSRLDRLRALRDRINLEIQVLEHGEHLLAQRKAREQRAAERERRRQERAAERRRERATHALARLGEPDAIEIEAPAHLVRAWARKQGIHIGDRGRISMVLRQQYLAHLDHSQEATG